MKQTTNQNTKKNNSSSTPNSNAIAEAQRRSQQLQAENNRLKSQIKANYQANSNEDPKRDRYLQELTWAEQSQRALRYPIMGANEKTALVDVPVRFDITSATSDGYLALRSDPLHLVEAQFDLAAASSSLQQVDLCDPSGAVVLNAVYASPMNSVSLDILRGFWASGSQMDIAGAPDEYAYAAPDGTKFLFAQAGTIATIVASFTALVAGQAFTGSLAIDRYNGSEIEENYAVVRGFANNVGATSVSFASPTLPMAWYRYRLEAKTVTTSTGQYIATNVTVAMSQTTAVAASRYIVNYAAPNLLNHAAAIQACRLNYLGGVLKNVTQEIQKGGRVAVARFKGQPLDAFDFNPASAYSQIAELADSINMTLTNGVFTFLPFGGTETLDFVRYFAPPEDGAAFSDSQAPLENARKCVIIAWQSPSAAPQALVVDLRLKLEFLTADPWFERAFATLDPMDIQLFNAAMIDSQRLPIACENDKHASILKQLRQSIRDMRRVVHEGKLLYKEVVPKRGQRVVSALLD